MHRARIFLVVVDLAERPPKAKYSPGMVCLRQLGYVLLLQVVRGTINTRSARFVSCKAGVRYVTALKKIFGSECYDFGSSRLRLLYERTDFLGII